MKPITKQTVKTASKLVTIGLLVGLLIGAFIAYGQSPSSTFTISSGVYPGAPSYTIWSEGSEYFAKDVNGLLAYSGTNASQILQSSLGSQRKILIKAGIHTFTSPIIGNYEALTIEMETGTILQADVSGVFLQFGIGWPISSSITIEGGEIYGGTDTTGLILFYGIKNSHINNMNLHGLIKSGSYAINFTSSWANYIDDTVIWNVQNGIWQGGAAGYFFIRSSYVNAWDYGTIGSTYNYEVYCKDGSIKAVNTLFEGGSLGTSVGIYIDWVGGCEITNCYFEGNTHLYEIWATAGAMNYPNLIEGGYMDISRINIPAANKYRFLFLGAQWIQTGTTNTASNTSVTLTHHLAGTPTGVWASFNSTAVDGWTWTATSTEITITVTPSGTYAIYWYAQCMP